MNVNLQLKIKMNIKNTLTHLRMPGTKLSTIKLDRI